MSTIPQLINPPRPGMDPDELYKHLNNINDVNNSLAYVMNPSVLNNANFATLGSHGTAPVTTDTDFSDQWNVLGAASASFTLTPTAYPTGLIAAGSPSLVPSASPYYINSLITTYTSGDFYFYQRQAGTVRKYQQDDLTFGIWIYNNLSTIPVIRPEIFNFYDTANQVSLNKPLYLQPGMNKVAVTVRTPKLLGNTLGAGNYTEFRLRFLNLGGSTANLNFHQIKCEFGGVTTLLNQ